MTKEEFTQKLIKYAVTSSDNYVTEENAIFPELVGMKMYEEPIIGFSSAEDELYTKEFKKDGVISPKYMAPKEWLANADTVVSLFFPFEKAVRESNTLSVDRTYDLSLELSSSAQWLHARIEGQIYLMKVMSYAIEILKEEGFDSVQPQGDKRWGFVAPLVSNWSERHAAYASGLGTFGLSKGLITRKGMAGRFASIITSAHFDADVRPYSSPFEYCIMCGACQQRCPAEAIDKSKGVALGKDHSICQPYVDSHKLPPFGPNRLVRYGCGKCQVAVPCEHEIPKRI